MIAMALAAARGITNRPMTTLLSDAGPWLWVAWVDSSVSRIDPP